MHDSIVSTRKKTVIIVILAILYFICSFAVVVINATGMQMNMGRTPVSGIITALQFLIAIFITLVEARRGGIVSIFLLFTSVFSATSNMIRNGDFSSAPGICFLGAAILAIALIRKGITREKELSSLDALTGVYNRRSMVAAIHDLVDRKDSFYLLYMDLDHFKYLNDVQGHEKGDEVLKQVVDLWSTVAPKNSMFGRIGGDEFLCLVPRKNEMDVEDLAAQFVSVLSQWRDDDKYSRFYLSASVGIASFPEDAASAQEMLRKADIAMYSAKRDGRNNYCKYDAWFDRAFLREQNVEIIIREAFKNHKFYMVYQPQYETLTKKIHGFEALIRLDNGNGENIGPGEFIPVAEKSSLIVDIGEFVLRKSTEDFAAYMREHRDLSLSINISAKQILSGNFVEVVKQVLEETKFPSECLEIEITEYCLMDATEEAIAVINQLKDLGIKLAMDDFGTGYSSLSYLNSLPIDMIKIDKSLIDAISEGEIVSAIISMGHALGCTLIAEGVEEERQLELLAQKSCDFIQGFIWGKPIRLEKAMDLLTEESEAIEANS